MPTPYGKKVLASVKNPTTITISEQDKKDFPDMAGGISAFNDEIRNLDPVNVEESKGYDDPVDAPTQISVDEGQAIRTSLYAAVAAEGNTFENYIKIKDQIQFGNLTVLDTLQRQADKRLVDSYKLTLQNIAGKVPASEFADYMRAAESETGNPADVKKQALEKTALAGVSDKTPSTKRRITEDYLKNLGPNLKVNRAINKAFDFEISRSKLDMLNSGTDLLDMVLPLQQIIAGKVAKEFLGETYIVKSGDMYRDLGRFIRNRPPEEQAAMAQKVVKSISRHAGVTVNNDMMKVFILEAIRPYALGEESSDWDRFVNNLFGFVELTGILPVRFISKLLTAKKLKVNGIDPQSPISEISKADPKAGAKAKAAAMAEETGNLAKEMGVTKEGIAKDALPKPRYDDLFTAGTPPRLVQEIQKLQGQAKRLLKVTDNFFFFRDIDYKNFMNKIANVITDTKAGLHYNPRLTAASAGKYHGTISYHTDKFRMGVVDDTDIIKYDAVYGKTDEAGFATMAEARNSAELFSSLGKDITKGSDFEILALDSKTGLLTPVDPKIFKNSVTSEKTIRARIRKLKEKAKEFRAAGINAGKVGNPNRERLLEAAEERERQAFNLQKGLKEGGTGDFYVKFSGEARMPYSAISPTDKADLPTAGTLGNWLKDAHSLFSLDFLKKYIPANEKRFLVDKDLLSLAEPYEKLPLASKRRVDEFIQRGNEEGKVFTTSELYGKLSTDEQIGYYSSRVFWDTVWDIKNHQARDKLLREGFKGFKVRDAEGNVIYENAGNPVLRERVDIKVAYDPVSQKEVRLTKGELDNIYDNGGTLVKVKSSVESGNSRYSFVVSRNADEVTDLPRDVLYKRDGYIFQLNVEPFYIKEVRDLIIDGKLSKGHERAFLAAHSKVEADSYIKSVRQERVDTLVNEGKSHGEASLTAESQYKVVLDRNIASTLDQLEADNMLLNTDRGYWFQKRGDRLLRPDGRKGEIQDSLSVMQKVSKALSNSVAQSDLIEIELIRHKKTFPQFYNSEGKYIGKTLSKQTEVTDDLKKANTWFRYIETMRTTPTMIDVMWKKAMVSLDQMIARLGSTTLSEASAEVLLKRLSSSTPAKWGTAITFNATLAIKPLRQVVLQGISMLHMSGIAPGLVKSSFGEGVLLAASLARKPGTKGYDMFVASASKMLGISKQEFITLRHEFRQTGKALAIDSNLYINELNFGMTQRISKTVLGQVAHGTANALKLPFRFGKAVGFDAGEIVNQATSWSFARKYWQKQNPGKAWNTSAAKEEISTMARNFSFDMTKTGALPYQRGALAAATQFWAINHKAALNLLPKHGNKQLAGKRGAYVVGMFAVYGLSGMSGLDDLYDEFKIQFGIDIPKPIDDLIKGGLLENMLNYSLDLAFSEEFGTTQLAWSEMFSPASQAFTFAPEAMRALLSGERGALEAIAGASTSVLGNMAKAAEDIQFIWGANPDNDSLDNIIQSVSAIGRRFGVWSDFDSYSNTMKYAYAQGVINRAKKYWALNKDKQPMVEASLSEIVARTLLGVKLKSEQELWEKIISNSRSRKDVESDAKKLSRNLISIFLDTKDTRKAFMLMREKTLTLYRGNPSYALQVLDMAMKRYFHTEPRSDQVVMKGLEYWKLHNPTASIEGQKGIIDNSDLIPDDQKQNVKDFLEGLHKEIMMAPEILNRKQ